MLLLPSTARVERRVRALAALAALTVLGGCATLPGPGADGAVERAADASVSLAPIGSVAPGRVAALPPGNPLGARAVLVLDEYHAASGRLCRRVVPPNTAATRTVCRADEARWEAVRALGGSARPAPPVPAAEPSPAHADG